MIDSTICSNPYDEITESTINSTHLSAGNTSASTELSLSSIRDFIISQNGKVKYSDLFNHFRDLIVDSASGMNFILNKHLSGSYRS
jgi:hypothetical protein